MIQGEVCIYNSQKTDRLALILHGKSSDSNELLYRYGVQESQGSVTIITCSFCTSMSREILRAKLQDVATFSLDSQHLTGILDLERALRIRVQVDIQKDKSSYWACHDFLFFKPSGDAWLNSIVSYMQSASSSLEYTQELTGR